jgi:hypothetical protein
VKIGGLYLYGLWEGPGWPNIREPGGLAKGREGQHREDDDLSPFGDLIGVHDENST